MFDKICFLVIQIEIEKNLGVSGKSARTIRDFSLELWQDLVLHFSTFDDKLKSQCIRNCFQSPPFCQKSIQNTFIFPRYLTIKFLQIIVQTTNLKNRKSENPKTHVH